MKTTCHRPLLDLLESPERGAGLPLQDWDTVLRLARRTNLTGRLAETLAASGVLERLPAPVQPHLQAALALSAHQRQAIVWEARHVAAALAPLNLQVVLLKGAGYAAANLRAARGRLYGDVDILVAERRLPEVEAALMLHGWGSGHVDPYDDRYYRRWMHELPPMVHRKRGTLVDVHHNILPRTARGTPLADRLLQAAVVPAGSAFAVLAPADMVIHSATHLFHEGELGNGLRDLLDLADLVTEFAASDAAFWPALIERAGELGLVWPLRLAFRYLERILDYPVPPQAIAGLGRTPLADRLRDAIYVPGFRPAHPLCDSPATAAARVLLYLRGHMLRMPPGLLLAHLGRKAVMRLFKSSSRST